MGGDGKGNKLRMGGFCCTKTVQAARKKQSAHRNNGLLDSTPFTFRRANRKKTSQNLKKKFKISRAVQI